MSISKEIQKPIQERKDNWDMLKQESPETISKREHERLKNQGDYIKKGLDKKNFYKL